MPLAFKTVGAVERDASLLVVAAQLIGLLLSILIAKTERDVRCQLVTNGGRPAVTLNVLRKQSAGIISIFIE